MSDVFDKAGIPSYLELDGGITAIERSNDLPEFERLGEHAGRHAPDDGELEPALTLEQLAAAEPIAATCSRRFHARRSSGTRLLSSIDLLVVHCTQGASARGAAAWFSNDDSRGSAHVVVDRLECYRTLAPSTIPWGAAGVNGRGWHLELAGYAEWSRNQWLEHRGTLNRGAFKLAYHGRRFEIPLTRLSRRQLAAGHDLGVIDHATASAVYGGSHWDPGPHFPWDVFMKKAKAYGRVLDRLVG